MNACQRANQANRFLPYRGPERPRTGPTIRTIAMIFIACPEFVLNRKFLGILRLRATSGRPFGLMERG